MTAAALAVASGLSSRTAEDERFQVYSRLEILQILRGLVDKGELATVYFGSGSDFVVSMLLSVNPQFEEVVLDLGADKAANERMLRAGRVLIVSQLDHIRIQFHAAAAERTTFEDAPAFRVRLPEAVMRLQRREYYRVRIPSKPGLRLGVPPVIDRGARVPLRVVDLSCGGVGLADLPREFRCESGMDWPDCSMVLPDIGMIRLDVNVVRVVETPAPGGAIIRRAGAKFLNVTDGTRAQLQRYVNRIERDINR